MISGNQHEMVICATYPTGAQEWFCPTCGRRYVLQWPPSYSKIVLEVGDEMAVHVGGSGAGQAPAQTGHAEWEAGNDTSSTAGWRESIESQEEIQEDVNDPYLAPFVDWLDHLEP